MKIGVWEGIVVCIAWRVLYVLKSLWSGELRCLRRDDGMAAFFHTTVPVTTEKYRLWHRQSYPSVPCSRSFLTSLFLPLKSYICIMDVINSHYSEVESSLSFIDKVSLQLFIILRMGFDRKIKEFPIFWFLPTVHSKRLSLKTPDFILGDTINK